MSSKEYREANKVKIAAYNKKRNEELPLSLVAYRHKLPKPRTEGEVALLEVFRMATLTKRIIRETK